MSGLAMRLRLDSRPADHEDRRAVWAMLAAAEHRGPDGQSVREDGPLVAGHARLVVTAEDRAEHQPLVDAATGRFVVADVRLDNRAELCDQLAVPAGAVVSDAALLLRAYDVWGTVAPERLLGDFAFVLWDPGRGRVLCARDTAGQRTLFYRVADGVLTAASEVQQLLQDPATPVVPDEAHILEFLVPANVLLNEKARSSTFFQGVSALLPGHVLVAEGAHVHTRSFWKPGTVPERRYRSDAEYAEHFKAVFFEAVRARLRSVQPVGVMLSGGLDSSSVACAAQELFRTGAARDPGFTGFSATYPGLECDERDLIEDVVAQHGFAARYVPAPLPGASGSAGTSDEHPLEPAGFMETPLTRSGPREALFREASAMGVRVLLTGDVADSCVRGSPLVFDSLLRQGHLRRLWHRVRSYRRTSDDSLLKIGVLYAAGPLLPAWAQRSMMAAHALRGARRDRDRLLPAWMPETLRRELYTRHESVLLDAERGRRYANPGREAEARLLYPAEVARPAAGWPLEIWRPFADRRLHEFLFSVPPEQKFSPHPHTDDNYAASKQLLRRAMRGSLPERIRTRTGQTHFAAAFESQLDRHWPAYTAAFGPGGSPEVARRGYTDRERFWTRLNQVRAGARGADYLYVMRLVALETWLRSFSLPRAQLTALAHPVAAAAASMSGGAGK